jgi:hypothetical protein
MKPLTNKEIKVLKIVIAIGIAIIILCSYMGYPFVAFVILIVVLMLSSIFLNSPGQHKNGTTTKAKTNKEIKVIVIVIAIGIAIIILGLITGAPMFPYAAIVITSLVIMSIGAIILISPGQHKNGTTTKVIKVIVIVIAVVIAIIISSLFILFIWLCSVWPK